jgi:hypothetical protein
MAQSFSESAETYVRVRRLVIFCDPPLEGTPSLLRTAVTAQVTDRELLHGHAPDGRPIASYVRYRVENGHGQLTGWGPALDLLDDVRDDLKRLRLGHSLHEVLATELHDGVEPFGLARYPLSYRSISPWLALNEQNHDRYGQLRASQQRRELLGRIMVGNLLSLAKSAGHWVDGHIVCEIGAIREELVTHKGIKFLGFQTHCQMNFWLPEWLGIGKLVSKGYGLFERCEHKMG